MESTIGIDPEHPLIIPLLGDGQEESLKQGQHSTTTTTTTRRLPDLETTTSSHHSVSCWWQRQAQIWVLPFQNVIFSWTMLGHILHLWQWIAPPFVLVLACEQADTENEFWQIAVLGVYACCLVIAWNIVALVGRQQALCWRDGYTPLVVVARRLALVIATANLVMIVQRPALSYDYIHARYDYGHYGKTYQDTWNEAIWWMVAFVAVNAILLTSWYHYRSVNNNNNNNIRSILAPRIGNVWTVVWNEAKPTVIWISLFLVVPAGCHFLDSIDGAIPLLFIIWFCGCMIPVGIVLFLAFTRCWSLSTVLKYLHWDCNSLERDYIQERGSVQEAIDEALERQETALAHLQARRQEQPEALQFPLFYLVLLLLVCVVLCLMWWLCDLRAADADFNLPPLRAVSLSHGF